MTRVAAPLLALSLLVASAAAAQVQPGDVLVTEADAGTVVNIRDGGDFTGAPRFATGLGFPSSLCVGPGGDVLVSATNEILVITAGGDFTGATPFASGLPGDGRLACNESEILVGSNGTGEVYDVTGGGDFTGATPFAEGLPMLAGLLRDSEGTLWASTASGGIFDITGGGDFSMASPFASLPEAYALEEHAGMLLVASGADVIDFTAGGDLSMATPFAEAFDVRGLADAEGTALYAASGSGSGVWEISAGGDFSAEPPFASGVATTFGVAGIVHVPEPSPAGMGLLALAALVALRGRGTRPPPLRRVSPLGEGAPRLRPEGPRLARGRAALDHAEARARGAHRGLPPHPGPPGRRGDLLRLPARPPAAAVFERAGAVAAWEERLRALGHGERHEMSREEALGIAAGSSPDTTPREDPDEPNGLRPGERVRVRADDYGPETVEGELVASSAHALSLARRDAELGELVVHFPRAGFVVTRA